MSERNNLLYRFLSRPSVYNLVQRVLGSSTTLRPWFVREVLRVQKDDRVLDIGCGTSDILRYLPPVTYIGFEPDRASVEHARMEFGARGIFHVGYFDAAAAKTIGLVDVALATAVLHHLSDEQVGELFRLLRTVVKPGGRVITIDPTYVANQNLFARLMISLDRGRDVRTPEAYANLAAACFPMVTGRVLHSRFPPYDHWIMTVIAHPEVD